MYCILCGFLDDYDPTGFCKNCQLKMAINDKIIYLLALLQDAVTEVYSPALQIKILDMLFENRRRLPVSLDKRDRESLSIERCPHWD
jgi:hypothetical protein